MNHAQKVIADVTGDDTIPSYEATMVLAAGQMYAEYGAESLLKVLCQLLATTCSTEGNGGFEASDSYYTVDFTLLKNPGDDGEE